MWNHGILDFQQMLALQVMMLLPNMKPLRRPKYEGLKVRHKLSLRENLIILFSPPTNLKNCRTNLLESSKHMLDFLKFLEEVVS